MSSHLADFGRSGGGKGGGLSESVKKKNRDENLFKHNTE